LRLTNYVFTGGSALIMIIGVLNKLDLLFRNYTPTDLYRLSDGILCLTFASVIAVSYFENKTKLRNLGPTDIFAIIVLIVGIILGISLIVGIPLSSDWNKAIGLIQAGLVGASLWEVSRMKKYEEVYAE